MQAFSSRGMRNDLVFPRSTATRPPCGRNSFFVGPAVVVVAFFLGGIIKYFIAVGLDIQGMITFVQYVVHINAVPGTLFQQCT